MESRRLVSGVAGTRMKPRVGRSRSNVTRSSRVTETRGEEDRARGSTEDREVGGEQPQREGRAGDLQDEHGVGTGC